MKKLLYAVAAFAVLFTSCAKDDVVAPVEDKEALVSFCVNSPAVATRAYGDGETAQDLYYAVYDTQEGYVAGLSKVDGSVEIKTSATVNLNLVQGRSYEIIFWAQAEGAPYTFAEGMKADEATMTINDVTVLKANNEAYDAFYAYVEPITVNGAISKTVELKRPFAQLNVATADTELASTAGVDIATTGVTVAGVYSSFNLKSGAVTGNPTTAKFTPTAKATGKISANGNEYDHIAMNYLLVNDKKLVDVTLTLAEDATEGTDALTRNYSSVPVQRNYRTNIIGNILTSTADFNVEIKPGFVDDNEEYGVIDGKVYQEVKNTPDFIDAFENEDIDMVILTGDIDLNYLTMRAREDKILKVAKGREFTIDLGGYKLSTTSTQTGKNYDMFDVRGTLNVKNGTIEYEHKGENMGWSASTCIFNITAGGVLNLEGVTAKNLGGSDMAFVAHLNNWGEATLNVQNSTLESTYIAVRAFNSGYDMNNITIKDSTLKGKYCFWVHNYQAAGDSVGTDETLNLDILNGSNTFVYTAKAPIIYGFANPIYYDENGIIVVTTSEELADAVANKIEAISIKGEIDLATVVLSGYNGTIVGADETAVLTTTNYTPSADEAYQLRSQNLTFKNLSIQLPTGGNWLQAGFVGTGVIAFENCKFIGQATLNGKANWTFADCEFVSTEDGAYASFVYGAEKATFNNCSFSGVDRAAKVYGTGGVIETEYNDCTFTSTTLNKNGVEIDASYATTTVTLNNCSQTAMAGLYAVKGTKATVTVDGEIANVANAEMVGNGLWKAGSTYSVTNAEGLALLNSKLVENSAGVGVAVEILSNIDFTGKTWTPVRSHIDWKNTVNSFNGNGHTIKNLTINGQAMFTIFANSADVVFKNVIFDNAKVNGGSSINCAIIVGQTYNNLRLENVDVKNSTIVGSYKVATLVGTVYNEGPSTITATLKDCDVTTTSVKSTGYDFCTTGMVAFVYTGDNDNIAFENCSISDVKLYGPDNGYALHAAIYTTDADTNDLINEAEGVTVENVTFENI